MTIIEIKTEPQFEQVFHVIKRSYATVAAEFGLTGENAPTNPAFLSQEQFSTYLEKEVVMFGLMKEDVLVGCTALEKSADREDCYYLERLAVLPEERHQGFGRQLLDFAVQAVRNRKGRRIEIGIIADHSLLKKWYTDYGFAVTGTKQFEHLPFKVCFLAMDI
jgi:GNAT superfamily N-acetyltransferase